MIIWVDAQLSPALAPWLTSELGIEAYSVRYLKMVQRSTTIASMGAMREHIERTHESCFAPYVANGSSSAAGR